MEGQLTVFFENPFWVGIFERWNDQGYSVARVVFGSEPLDAELYVFVLTNYATLPFSEAITEEKEAFKPKNFKRMQRETRQATQENGVASKAHEALRLELEKNKKAREEVNKEKRDAEAAEKYRLRQERKKEKQRGH